MISSAIRFSAAQYQGYPIVPVRELRMHALLLAVSGLALSLVWLMLAPVWFETFNHARAGAGLQILILASATTIGGGAWQCLRLAARAWPAVGAATAVALRNGGSGAARACRSLHGWTLVRSRAHAPAACQREGASAIVST
jgi:hypothetical protein